MVERPRGTRDFGPEEMVRRRHLEDAFTRVAHRFGYQEVETPTFEHADLFIAKSGPGVVEEMYVFQDKGGRQLALRPELTAPVMRFYLSDLQSRPKPLKLYYLGRCYRYDEPQFGRYREFFQFGVEILGGEPVAADAEVVATAVAAMREAGLETFQLRVGHIGLVRDLLPPSDDQKARILNRLDKRDLEGLRQELEAADLADMEGMLLDLVGLKGGAGVLDAAADLLAAGGHAEAEGLAYLRDLGRRLALYGIDDLVYDLGVVRGLDYYTGMVFELHDDALGAVSQICGGGAYSLADVLGGDALPTTGFAVGFDRVLLALEEAGVSLPSTALDAFVIPIGGHMRQAGYRVLASLRAAGATADMDLVGRGPSRNLEYADSVGARVAVLVGEKEWSEGRVALKDLASGEQTELPLEDAVSALKASHADR